MFPIYALYKSCTNGFATLNKMTTEIYFNDIAANWFHRTVPHNALYQNFTNLSTPLNKLAIRAKNWNIFKHISPLITDPNAILFHRTVPHNALYQKYKNTVFNPPELKII